MFNDILLQVNQAITLSFCVSSILSLLIGLIWAIKVAYRDGFQQLKQLHQIPCDRCLYFTGCHHLKCTVHPCKALTVDAIHCLDFEPTSHSKSYCSNRCKP